MAQLPQKTKEGNCVEVYEERSKERWGTNCVQTCQAQTGTVRDSVHVVGHCTGCNTASNVLSYYYFHSLLVGSTSLHVARHPTSSQASRSFETLLKHASRCSITVHVGVVFDIANSNSSVLLRSSILNRGHFSHSFIGPSEKLPEEGYLTCSGSSGGPNIVLLRRGRARHGGARA